MSFRSKGNQVPFMMIVREFYNEDGVIEFASVIAEVEDITDLEPEYSFSAIAETQAAS